MPPDIDAPLWHRRGRVVTGFGMVTLHRRSSYPFHPPKRLSMRSNACVVMLPALRCQCLGLYGDDRMVTHMSRASFATSLLISACDDDARCG